MRVNPTAGSASFAVPKSSSLTRPSSDTRMLDGFKSRCTISWRCADCTASHTDRKSCSRVGEPQALLVAVGGDRLALGQVHDQVGTARVGHPGVEEADDVGMRERGEHPLLAGEARRGPRRRRDARGRASPPRPARCRSPTRTPRYTSPDPPDPMRASMRTPPTTSGPGSCGGGRRPASHTQPRRAAPAAGRGLPAGRRRRAPSPRGGAGRSASGSASSASQSACTRRQRSGSHLHRRSVASAGLNHGGAGRATRAPGARDDRRWPSTGQRAPRLPRRCSRAGSAC